MQPDMQSYGFTDHLKCLYFANNSKLEIVEPGTMDWLIRRHRSEVDISILWNVDFTCALVADRETDGVMDIFSPFWSFMALFGLCLTLFTMSMKSSLTFPHSVSISSQPGCQNTTINATLIDRLLEQMLFSGSTVGEALKLRNKWT